MNKYLVSERTIDIYLQIAETASRCADFRLSQSMLLAAYEQVHLSSQPVDLKTLTKLAEFLLMAKLTNQAEEMFNIALKKIVRSSQDNWLRARIYDGLAEVHFLHCHFDKARKKFELAIKIMTALPQVDPLLIGARRRKLTLLNRHQENMEKQARYKKSSPISWGK